MACCGQLKYKTSAWPLVQDLMGISDTICQTGFFLVIEWSERRYGLGFGTECIQFIIMWNLRVKCRFGKNQINLKHWSVFHRNSWYKDSSMLTQCKSVDGINPGHLEHFKNTSNTSEIEIATGEVSKDTMGAETNLTRTSFGKIYI